MLCSRSISSMNELIILAAVAVIVPIFLWRPRNPRPPRPW
jgi:hypothetical protein